METIRIYTPGEPEYIQLERAAEELTRTSPNGTRFTVKDVYFDFGQRWMWTTIIATRSARHHWQALCPRDYEKILYSSDIPATVAEITSDKYWYDG